MAIVATEDQRQRQRQRQLPSDPPLPHALHRPAFGKQHAPMHNGHFNTALKVMSIHLGLESSVTSRAFQTLFAFKSILAGTIPNWQVAQQMAHFRGNLHLCWQVYVPTILPVDPCREDHQPTELARRVLEANGSICHLPDKDQINALLVQEAQVLVSIFQEAAQREASDLSQPVPTSLRARITETFQQMNGRVQLPFAQSLSALVSLTSNGAAASWTTITFQQHPFDMQDVKRGEQDKGVIQWLSDSGPFLCPSCCLSTHHDEAATSELANNMYWEYNMCLASKHKKLCCFLCSELVPLDNGSHAAGCLAKHHASPLQAALRTYHQLTMVHSQSSQLYKAATHYTCAVLSCLNCSYVSTAVGFKTKPMPGWWATV